VLTLADRVFEVGEHLPTTDALDTNATGLELQPEKACQIGNQQVDHGRATSRQGPLPTVAARSRVAERRNGLDERIVVDRLRRDSEVGVGRCANWMVDAQSVLMENDGDAADKTVRSASEQSSDLRDWDEVPSEALDVETSRSGAPSLWSVISRSSRTARRLRGGRCHQAR